MIQRTPYWICTLLLCALSFANDPSVNIEELNKKSISNETDASDDMMLIWPKIPPGGDPTEVKKALESQRLLDKIKHGAVAINVEETLEETEITDSGKALKRSTFHGLSLSRVLLKMSSRGHLPPLYMQDSSSPFWDQKLYFSYDASSTSTDLLNQLAKLLDFKVMGTPTLTILSPNLSNKRLLKPVTIHGDKIALMAVLKSILGTTGLNAVISEELKDVKVSVYFKQVPAEKALRALVSTYNLDYKEVNQIHMFGAHKASVPKIEEHREIIKIEKTK